MIRSFKRSGPRLSGTVGRSLLPLLLLTGLAEPSLSTPVALSLRLANPAPAQTPVVMTLTAHQASTASETNKKSWQVDVPGEVDLELEPGTWRLAVEHGDFWARAWTITLGEQPQEGTLRLWPVAHLAGRWQVADPAEGPPVHLLARFQGAPQPPSAPAADLTGEAPCKISGDAWTCKLPAGAALDVRLEAEGFINHYFWGLELAAKETRQAGLLAFKRGAEVAGWVVSEDPAVKVEGTRLQLSPRSAGSALEPKQAERWTAVTLEVMANDRGFFHLAGVPPGAYLLEATKAPLAPARASVRVLPNQLTMVANPPLTLAPPLKLQIYIDPPVTPQGVPWKVEWSQVDRGSAPLAPTRTSHAALDGSWVEAGWAPGKYFLRILDDAGAVWLGEVITLESGADPSPLLLELPTIEVRGRLLLGDQPLLAELSFGGAPGYESVSFASDALGTFRGLLPKAGTWLVEISAAEPRVRRERLEVVVEEKPGQAFAELSIELPATRLQGTVVTEEGMLVPGALVTVFSSAKGGASTEDEASDTGAFEMWGFPPGVYALIAEHGSASGEVFFSDQVQVELEEDRQPSPVRLELRREIKVRGRVLAATGAVPGALIKAEPLDMPSFPLLPRHSDASGSFAVSLPAAASRVFLSVAPPGFAFRMLALEARALKEPLDVPVSTEMGTLVFELPAGLDQHTWGGVKVLVQHGSAQELLGYLLHWASLNGVAADGQRVVVPAMEPGDYSACIAPLTQRAAVLLGSLSAVPCASGYLSPSGELTLRLGAER